jgi:PAS domain S-box-containing protein
MAETDTPSIRLSSDLAATPGNHPPVVVEAPSGLPAALPIAFMHQIAAFMAVLTPEGTVLEVNEPALQFGGLTRADVVGKPFWECFWWNFDAQVQARLRDDIRKVKAGETVRREVVVRAAGDARLMIDFMLAPLLDEAGRVTHLIPSGTDISDRKEAEQKLAAAQTRAQRDLAVLQSVVDSAPVGISVMDRDLRWLQINERLAEINGLPVEAHRGRTLPDLFPEVAQEMVPRFEQVFETGQAILNQPLVTQTPAAPGRDRHFEVSVVPVRDEADEVFVVSAIVTETTERVEARRRLRKSKQRAERDRNEIESIYQLAPVGLCVLDRELRWLRINERQAEINGFSREQLLGKTVYEMLPDVAEPVAEMVQQVLETGMAVMGQEVVGQTPAQPNVERAWIVSYAPVFDDEHRPVAVNVIAEEITERRNAKRELEQALATAERRRARLESLNNVSPAGLCYHDADLVIRYANDRLQDINGIANARILGKHPYELNQALAKQVVPLLQRVLFDGKPIVNHQITWAPADEPDRPHHYLVNYGRVEGEDGKPDGVMAAVVDITEIIEQRQQLESWSQHLETEVARRTAELTQKNRRLRDMSQEVMAAQNRERQRISKILHDDLQQTLSAAFLNCDLIARGRAEADDPIHELRSEIELAVKTARDLSHDLFPSVLITHGLPAALRWLADEYRRRFKLDIQLTAADDLDDIPGQARAFLYDVTRELLFNVHKHADTPRADVTLQTRDGGIELIVHDNGKGCDPNRMLPDPDATGHPSARKSLGLPMIYHRLALLDGDMQADSVPGDGCKLTIRLPLDALTGPA